MSVEVLLSSRHIVIDQAKQGILNIKASFATASSTVTALYKIRTNFKDVVDVRPAFGLLRPNEDDSIASMKIRYTGELQDVKKIKLQVSWVWGQGVPTKKLSHNQFADIYKTLKEQIGKEKHHMLQFTTKELQKSQDSLEIQEKPGSNPLIQGQSEKTIEKNEITEEVNRNKENLQEQTKTKVKRVSIIALITGILIAFALGVLTGFKLEKFLNLPQPLSTLQQFESKTSQPFSIEQQIGAQISINPTDPQNTQPSSQGIPKIAQQQNVQPAEDATLL